MSSEWKKWLGAQVTLRTMEWKTYLDARRTGDFMLSRQSWDATYNDASSFLNTLKSDIEENVGHWKNAQYGSARNHLLEQRIWRRSRRAKGFMRTPQQPKNEGCCGLLVCVLGSAHLLTIS
ncbi:hypothetical protein BK373_28255 [Escherichia coli]|nr:hypothetical protein BK373_28255 [Escherichia coli]